MRVPTRCCGTSDTVFVHFTIWINKWSFWHLGMFNHAMISKWQPCANSKEIWHYNQHLSWMLTLPFTYGNRICQIKEMKLYALVFNIALSKCMPCVHICGVFTVYCVSVCLLAVRFHIQKENSSMKMNLKRKGIRYNKLLVWLGFFTFRYAIRKHHDAKWKLMKHKELTENVFPRQSSLKTVSQTVEKYQMLWGVLGGITNMVCPDLGNELDGLFCQQ